MTKHNLQDDPMPQEPHRTSNGPFGKTIAHLMQLRPPEPAPEALARIWQAIAAAIESAAPAAVRLEGMRPAQPDAPVIDAIWQRVAHQLQVPEKKRRPSVGPRLAAAFVTLLVLVVVTAGSASALPGSPLYAVKQAWEEIQWRLTVSPDDRAQLALTLADRRWVEADRLVQRAAPSALVAQTIEASLRFLARTDGLVPAEQIAARLEEWESQVMGWPGAYQTAAMGLIAGWVEDYPELQTEPTLPPGESAVTALPPTSDALQTDSPAPNGTLVPATPSLAPAETALAPAPTSPLPPSAALSPLPSLPPLPIGTPTLPLP